MKKWPSICLALIGMILSLSAYIPTGTIPEPAYTNRVYFLNNDSLISLERADADYETVSKVMYTGIMETRYNAFYPKSTRRFKKESLPRMFIKLEAGIDANDNPVVLSMGEIKKDQRHFVTAGSKLFGKKDERKTQVVAVLHKMRDNIYEVTFENGLLPGEYCVLPIHGPNATSTMKVKIDCFGID